nr:PREDICTED: probable E3 ubiquitin-protein ligase makorin-1 [Latimeria chalumnae]|eukprot:XP_005988540.2 PREDICTED: probable E3 ubiquitin-protein ligase makorin-1 [Latimeria chalumnae]
MQKSSQICRHFQKGFCYFGDRCWYQHSQPAEDSPPGSRRGSEPTIQLAGRGISSGRRGSEPTILPVVPRGFAGVRRESEPVAPSLMQLNTDFGRLSTEFEEEEEDKENGAPSGRSEDWALTAEFVPRRFSREQKSQRLMPREGGGLQYSASSDHLQEPSRQASFNGANWTEPDMEERARPQEWRASGPEDLQRDSAAYERSKNVTCGICMDRVYEKSHPGERKFGILPNCNHAYCVSCIKKWRKSKDFQSEIIKSCPECRVKSSYFIPHKYWIIDMNQKQKLIENFRARTSKIRCKFFVRGNGRCPFKSECIYLHELPAGRPPGRRRERRRTRPTQVRTKPPVQRTLASKARG